MSAFMGNFFSCCLLPDFFSSESAQTKNFKPKTVFGNVMPKTRSGCSSGGGRLGSTTLVSTAVRTNILSSHNGEALPCPSMGTFQRMLFSSLHVTGGEAVVPCQWLLALAIDANSVCFLKKSFMFTRELVIAVCKRVISCQRIFPCLLFPDDWT